MNKLNKADIIKLLPHREPMLLVDELYDIIELKSATAVLNVTKKSINYVSEISEVTINKCYKKIEQLNIELIPSQFLEKYKDKI